MDAAAVIGADGDRFAEAQFHEFIIGDVVFIVISLVGYQDDRLVDASEHVGDGMIVRQDIIGNSRHLSEFFCLFLE